MSPMRRRRPVQRWMGRFPVVRHLGGRAGPPRAVETLLKRCLPGGAANGTGSGRDGSCGWCPPGGSRRECGGRPRDGGWTRRCAVYVVEEDLLLGDLDLSSSLGGLPPFIMTTHWKPLPKYVDRFTDVLAGEQGRVRRLLAVIERSPVISSADLQKVTRMNGSNINRALSTLIDPPQWQAHSSSKEDSGAVKRPAARPDLVRVLPNGAYIAGKDALSLAAHRGRCPAQRAGQSIQPGPRRCVPKTSSRQTCSNAFPAGQIRQRRMPDGVRGCSAGTDGSNPTAPCGSTRAPSAPGGITSSTRAARGDGLRSPARCGGVLSSQPRRRLPLPGTVPPGYGATVLGRGRQFENADGQLRKATPRSHSRPHHRLAAARPPGESPERLAGLRGGMGPNA